MRITEFINSEFKDFVNYDNKRNIPHILDGLKWSQRKVLYAFINHIGNNKIVVDKAGMRAAEKTHYAHGATSLMGVIVGMAQTFPGTNNLNLLDPLGQFGNRLDHEASSERYISTKLNDNYKKLFDENDNHILRKQYIEGDEVEPQFYLPKLPLLLINGSKGTGNGFAATILAYNPQDVKKAVQECLNHGYVKSKLVPYISGYKGTIKKDHGTGQVTYTGLIEVKNTTTLVINELPPGMCLEKYEDHLNKLVLNKFIKDYDNESKEGYWRFVIDCPRTTTALDMQTLLEKFKLIEKATETLCVWLPNGKPRIFDSVEDLIAVWVDLRLEFYETRRLDMIARYNKEALWLTTKQKFILWWNDNAEKLVKLKRDDLLIEIEEHVTEESEYIDRLLAIRVSNLGADHAVELAEEILKYKKLVGELEATTNKSMMESEVKSIKI